jgi:CRISPR-associated protein Csm1
MEYQTLILAGLIHDIGKFLQIGHFGNLNVEGKHPQVSADFVNAYQQVFNRVCNAGLLRNLVMKHHEATYFPDALRVDTAPEEIKWLAYLLSRADNYSSSERGQQDDKYHNYKKRPLDSIFCRLDIGKEVPEKILQYQTGIYSPANGFPISLREQPEEALNKLLCAFSEEFASISKNTVDFRQFYNQLYSLLMKYTWCIPSNSQEKIADISFFDHLKTTSAISACLYIYHQDKKEFSLQSVKDDEGEKFCLLVGDLSGIQSYLFSGAKIGAGGVAKRLRARSFYISMLSELVAQLIIDEFNLPVSNIVMASGGKFYILLPNTSFVQVKIVELQQRIDRILLTEYQGEIALNLSAAILNGKDFARFGSVVAEVNQKLAVKKKEPFNTILKNKNNWVEDNFLFQVSDKKGLGLCRGCGREFAEKILDDKEYGEKCIKDIQIGQKIPRMKYLKLCKGGLSDISIGKEIGLELVLDTFNKPSKNLLIAINNTEVDPDNSIIFKFIANYVPNERGQAISFDELAKKSQGIKRIAYLKADVDNLGKLFAFGLKGNKENYDTISRVTTFSRMLDLFFAGRVNELVSQEFINCYIIYSGGDDLLIAGPWNEIIELAGKINQEFTRFTGNNANITLSAGIALAKTRTPVAKAVELAEEFLEESKEKKLMGNRNGRNQVTFFGRTLSWEMLHLVIEEGNKLTSWATQKKLTKADLWKLKKYDGMYQDFVEKNNVAGLNYKAFLAYQIGRSKKENKADEAVVKWEEELFNQTSSKLLNLGPIVDYALCAVREENKDE